MVVPAVSMDQREHCLPHVFYDVQLHANLEAVTTSLTEKEATQLSEVQEILASQKNITWPSGLEENN